MRTALLAIFTTLFLGCMPPPPPFQCDDDAVRLETGSCLVIEDVELLTYADDLRWAEWATDILRYHGADMRGVTIHLWHSSDDVRDVYEADYDVDNMPCISGFNDFNGMTIHAIPGALGHEVVHHQIGNRGGISGVDRTTGRTDIQAFRDTHTPEMGWFELDTRRASNAHIMASPQPATGVTCYEVEANPLAAPGSESVSCVAPY